MMRMRRSGNSPLRIADFQIAVLRHRQIELADLIAFGQVGIVVVLAVPFRERGDVAVQSQGCLQRQAETPRGS